MSPQEHVGAGTSGADAVEAAHHVRDMVVRYLESTQQANPEKNLRELFEDDGGFVERFQFFMPKLGSGATDHMLISGCSAGTELLVAKRFGFSRVSGVEVSSALVDICRARLQDEPTCSVALYDGLTLPYESDTFSVVYSGHVIEHTPDPFRYFREHLRVLRPGGFLFVEFPNRYHHTELHTGLPSFEWLPGPLRDICLRIMASSIVTDDRKKRDGYRDVRTTLRPISLWQLRYYCRRIAPAMTGIIATQTPAPGYCRVLIQK